MIYKPALGSYFVDSYSKSSACNGCTWIFDGFTNWSTSVDWAVSLAAAASVRSLVVWLWWCDSHADDDDEFCDVAGVTVEFISKKF